MHVKPASIIEQQATPAVTPVAQTPRVESARPERTHSHTPSRGPQPFQARPAGTPLRTVSAVPRPGPAGRPQRPFEKKTFGSPVLNASQVPASMIPPAGKPSKKKWQKKS